MGSLSQISQKHHAYLIRGDGEYVTNLLKNAIEKIFNVTFDGNPDCHIARFETFGIDEARKIKEDQEKHSFAGEYKFFLINTFTLTHEAQNALLKVFEEPTAGTYIFLIMPPSAQVLPTLKSRLFDLEVILSPQNDDKKLAKDFLSKNAPERLKFIKKIIENKDKTAATSLMNALEETLGTEIKANLPPEEIFILEEIRKGRGYLNDRSPSVKMILEHISLILPRIKY